MSILQRSARSSVRAGLSMDALTRAIAAAALAGGAAAPAFAQEAAQPVVAQQPEVTTQSSEKTTADKAQEIVITGSLIKRRDATSSSPISTVDSSVLSATASPSLDKAIGQLPQFSA